MKPPYIRRVPKEKNYTVIDNNYLFDNRLSLKAKGLLSMMLSRPDDWIFHNDELISHSTDGEKSFRAGFKELQECGYVDRFPIYENRKIVRWVTVVNEVSETLERSVLAQNLQVQNLQVGKVQVQKEEVQNLQVGNDTLLSTDINQVLKKPSTNNISIQQAEQFNLWWDLYGKKEGRKKCEPKFKQLLKNYSYAQIEEGTKRYLEHRANLKARGEFVPNQKNPYTFLYNENFMDEYEPATASGESYKPLEERTIKPYSGPYLD